MDKGQIKGIRLLGKNCIVTFHEYQVADGATPLRQNSKISSFENVQVAIAKLQDNNYDGLFDLVSVIISWTS